MVRLFDAVIRFFWQPSPPGNVQKTALRGVPSQALLPWRLALPTGPVVGQTYVLWESSLHRRDGLICVLAVDVHPSWPVLTTCTVRARTTIVTWTPSTVPIVRLRYHPGDVFCVPLAHLHPLGVAPQNLRRCIRSDGQLVLS